MKATTLKIIRRSPIPAPTNKNSFVYFKIPVEFV